MELQLWSKNMPTLYDLDENGYIQELRAEKRQPWSKAQVKQKMNFAWDNSLYNFRDLVHSFIPEINADFYQRIIFTPFVNKDCVSFLINPYVLIEARLNNPLLWSSGWAFSYYTIIGTEEKPTHLKFYLMHSQGEYSEISFPAWIPELTNKHRSIW